MIAGALIAGGRGRRMGVADKALLPLPGGGTPAGRILAALAGAGCGPLLVSANDPRPWAGLGVRVVADREPDRGPLAGIAAALEAAAGAGAEGLCLVAGDMPGMDRATLAWLIATWDGRLTAAWHDGPQPLCAVVATSLAGAVRDALERGPAGVGRLWLALDAAWCPFPDPAPFRDLDTPEDLAGWSAPPVAAAPA